MPNMDYNKLAQLDKDWLRDAIADKQTHLDDVSGALASEVISDLFVLGNGGLTVAFAVATRSLVPVAANPLPMVQIVLAYLTIKALVDQRRKIQNDLHVLNAILQIDEETPENITAMVHDYIEIHTNPDNEGHPSHLDVKSLSPEALRVIQKNFRMRGDKRSLLQKTLGSGVFLAQEFKNAARMMGATIARPLELGKAILVSAQNIKKLYREWDDVDDSRHSETLRDVYKRTLRIARRADEVDVAKMPPKLDDFFNNKRKQQLYYLHQQQASLRTVSRMRVETAVGLCACSGIIGIALVSTFTAASVAMAIGGVYTVVASLPSIKILGGELQDLTRTSEKHAPKINKAAADFMMGMPGR